MTFSNPDESVQGYLVINKDQKPGAELFSKTGKGLNIWSTSHSYPLFYSDEAKVVANFPGVTLAELLEQHLQILTRLGEQGQLAPQGELDTSRIHSELQNEINANLMQGLY